MINEEKLTKVESQILDLLRQNKFTLEEYKNLKINLDYSISKSLI
ncbi:MAG: hypothetical protein PHD60_08285 [Clostridia bacterium]|nr:hypothetical protein [Clostridia bacterium]